MTATVASRVTIRTKLQQVFATKLVTELALVKTVTAYPPAKLQGLTPIVAFESIGTSGPVLAPTVVHKFQANIFVMYVDSATSWDEQDATDRLDAISAVCRALFVDYSDRTNEVDPEWLRLDTEEGSTVNLYIEGQEYLHESITFLVEAENTG